MAGESRSESVLAGADVSIRYFFVPDARWNSASERQKPLNLEFINDRIATSSAAASHVSRISSFYRDVTIPLTTRNRLPVVARVDSFPGTRGIEDTHPLHVDIEISAMTTVWEDRTVALPSARVPALFTDVLVLFDSGHVLYAPAFVLRVPHTTVTQVTPGGEDRVAKLISALTSLVDSPGAGLGRELDELRSKIAFKLSGEAQGCDLLSFLRRRLAAARDASQPGNVFFDLLRSIPHPSPRWWQGRPQPAVDGIADLTWRALQSASVEVVGATRYADVARWCDMARDAARADKPGRPTTIGRGERTFAALAQNVLDVDHQDEQEVIDSLSQSVVTAEDVLLIHPKLALRYSRIARPYTQMRDTLGGCPYFLLTNVVTVYNEFLLDRNAHLVDRLKESTRNLQWVRDLGRSTTRNEHAEFAARFQLLENHTLYALPNIFRYPTERVMFDQIVKQRGLDQRTAAIERFTTHVYQLRKDVIDHEERRISHRTNGLLLALAVFQVSGLILAALALKELETEQSFFAGQTARILVWFGFAMILAIGAVAGIRAFMQR
jgi:hypothetical protein